MISALKLWKINGFLLTFFICTNNMNACRPRQLHYVMKIGLKQKKSRLASKRGGSFWNLHKNIF